VAVQKASVAGMEQVRVAAVHRPSRRWPLVVAGILLVLVWAASGLARFFLDLLWFREVDKTQVFWGVLGTEVGLGLVTGLGTAVIVGGNLWMAERLSVAAGLRPVQEPGVESLRRMLVPLLRWLRLGAVALLGLLVGLYGAGQWRTYMLWRNQVPFGDQDAQFGRDIGFYVFSLPLQRAVFGWLPRCWLWLSIGCWVASSRRPGGTGSPRTCMRICRCCSAASCC
jgi:uncharacterized membrane protein (UPF0182 family)